MRTLNAKPQQTKHNDSVAHRRIAIAICLSMAVLCSHSAFAVNYMDPNLSERKDKIAQAALACSGFLRLNDAFKNCLISNGVTDGDEQKDALDQAASMSANTGLNNPNRQTDPGDALVNNTRAPASARASR